MFDRGVMIIRLSVSASISMKNSASSVGNWFGVIIMTLSVSPTKPTFVVVDWVTEEILSSSVSGSISTDNSSSYDVDLSVVDSVRVEILTSSVSASICDTVMIGNVVVVELNVMVLNWVEVDVVVVLVVVEVDVVVVLVVVEVDVVVVN